MCLMRSVHNTKSYIELYTLIFSVNLNAMCKKFILLLRKKLNVKETTFFHAGG